MPDLLTPLDRTRSPHTGYVRDHWIEIITKLVKGVLAFVDRDTGMPHFAGDPQDAALTDWFKNPGGLEEAFDRTHLLIAIYIAATGRTHIDGVPGDIAELYRRGMDRLYDPARPGYPPRSNPLGLALGMLLAPVHFLDALSLQTRVNLAGHLQKFIHRPTSDCNTMLFSMMPVALLERLGAPYDRPRMDDYFDRILSMYKGGGWFIDGWNRGYDFYNFWGFQLYLHALAAYDTRWRERYARRIQEITAAHERSLVYWFGKDGGPIAKGRSLNYRFAAVSGIAYSQLSGLSSLDPGVARRIASGCLKYFYDNGCISDRGLLEVGYHGPNAALGEDYSDKGAPYWGSTGLVAAALPPDHPFWTATEKPLPADEPGVKRHLVAGAKMLLKADGDRGEARALVAGEPFLHRRVWQAGTKYFQHAYSSTLGFALTGEGGPQLAAGRTAFSTDGKTWAFRTWPRALSMTQWRLRSAWDGWPALEGTTGSVVTDSLILDHGEVHVFRHTADSPRYLCLGGWALQIPHATKPDIESLARRVTLQSATMWSTLELLWSPDVVGEIAVEEVHPREGFRHSHLFGGWSAYPLWRSRQPVPPGQPVVIFVDAALAQDGRQPQYPTLQARLEGEQLVLESAPLSNPPSTSPAEMSWRIDLRSP